MIYGKCCPPPLSGFQSLPAQWIEFRGGINCNLVKAYLLVTVTDCVWCWHAVCCNGCNNIKT